MSATLDAPPSQPVASPRKKRWLTGNFLVISIIVHLLLGLGAAYFVVQQIYGKRKVTFQGGPPSENPSKRALEHKVSMAKKQSVMSAPVQSKRIAVAGMAKISLPELPSLPTSTDMSPSKMAGMGGQGVGLGVGASGGMGGGMGAGGGGGALTAFGFRERVNGALVGTFYDLKQTRSKRPSPAADDNHAYTLSYREFVNKGWNRSILDEFYKSKAALYATQIFIPDMPATEGPKAFDVDRDVQPSRWVVAYKGRVSPPEDGTYHFVGLGDDVLVVRFNGKIVLDACWADKRIDRPDTVSTWKPDKTYDYHWPSKLNQRFSVGDPMEIKAGQFYDIEVLIGERPGGGCFACLLTEKNGANYEKDREGNPILPPFRLAPGPPPKLQKGQTYPPFQKDGPVWKSAAPKSASNSALDDFFGPK